LFVPELAHPMPPAPIPRPGLVELEFGVPIPGVVLEEAQWARTALKRLPEGIWNWDHLFGREAPVIVDIGCGNGRSTLHLAVSHPERNVLGVDILPVVIRYATRRANQRGLTHTRLAVVGGRELLERHVAPHSVNELHCYHPQPFYDRREVGRRLITPEFLLLAHRALVPGGTFVLQTDHPGYWKYIRDVVPTFFEWHEQSGPWPDSPQGRTRREIMARSKGLPIFRGWGIARGELSWERALEQARQLPPPTFDADRQLQTLDQLERDSGEASATPPRRPRRRSRGDSFKRRR
jgi:tRNA (guanine-N7-)-methyltransferase